MLTGDCCALIDLCDIMTVYAWELGRSGRCSRSWIAVLLPFIHVIELLAGGWEATKRPKMTRAPHITRVRCVLVVSILHTRLKGHRILQVRAKPIRRGKTEKVGNMSPLQSFSLHIGNTYVPPHLPAGGVVIYRGPVQSDRRLRSPNEASSSCPGKALEEN